jgi:type VI protein secretion system component Hcp
VQHAEIYLDLSSANIFGEAEAVNYEHQIELMDWKWGLGLDAVNNDNPPHGVGKKITIKKPLDKASTALLKHLECGPVIPKGTLVLVQRDETNMMVRLELEGITFTSYKINVESDDNEVSLSEDWELSYTKIKVQYKGRSDKGNDVRGKVGSLSTIDFTLEVPKNASMESSESLSAGEPGVDGEVIKEAVADAVKEEISKQSAQTNKQEIHKIIDEYMKKNKAGSLNKIGSN